VSEPVRSIYAAWERGDHRSAEWAEAEIESVSDHANVLRLRNGWVVQLHLYGHRDRALAERGLEE
jgi:hypothetical protein